MRGVTVKFKLWLAVLVVSTHTPHARRDTATLRELLKKVFQLTRLMRGVTWLSAREWLNWSFQLTRLMRGVTDVIEVYQAGNFGFNSHASCEA